MTMPTFEPVVCEYRDTEGKWKPFLNAKHEEDTIASGDWFVRSLYSADQLTEAYEAGKRDAAPQGEQEPALVRYERHMADEVETDPIERLRFFLSLALTGQNWIDVEKFINDLTPAPAVPDGWKLVPDASNMTDEQAEAIAERANCCGGIAYDIYRALLEASPEPTK